MKADILLLRILLTSIVIWIVAFFIGILKREFVFSIFIFKISILIYYTNVIHHIFFAENENKYSEKFGLLSVGCFISTIVCWIFGLAHLDIFINVILGISAMGFLASLIIAALCLIWDA